MWVLDNSEPDAYTEKKRGETTMWKDTDPVWQTAFDLAWESYCKGSLPIGAVIVDENGTILSRGRNMVNEATGEQGESFYHKLSHAELNVLLKISAMNPPDIRSYALYTTMEPCPMCFGAAVMANIRDIRFAARDPWAGSTSLRDANDYLRRKAISLQGPFAELETVQITLQSIYELEHNKDPEALLHSFRTGCPLGVDAAYQLFKGERVKQLCNQGARMSEVFDTILSFL